MSLTDMSFAELFSNGSSQAVNLPDAFRMPGTHVKISREGARVVLEPVEQVHSEQRPAGRDSAQSFKTLLRTGPLAEVVLERL